MQKITLDQFCNQWAKDKQSKPWSSVLAFNVEEFTTKAGGHALGAFRESFIRGGFYGSGQKWAPRASKWGKKFKHPIMIDQAELKCKIKGAKSGSVGNTYALNKRESTRRYRYNIWTEEVSKPVKGKRGRKKGRYKNYAAVHNTDPKFGLYRVNQYSAKKPEQRQFIGHSDKILDKINEVLVPQIFKNFPGMK